MGKTGGASQEAPEAFGQVRQPISYLPALIGVRRQGLKNFPKET